MPEIQPVNYQTQNYTTGTPLYNYPAQPQQQGTVSISTPNGNQIYNYPQASVYGDKNKQAASGVNIYIYNPSAIGGPTSNSTANATYTMPGQEQAQPIAQTGISGENTNPAYTNMGSPTTNITAPIAQTPINSDKADVQPAANKTKNIVELTDDYIKTLESYLKSADSKIRQSGIKELVNRFEEDDSRYEDPALTALLNIALLDPQPSNRLMAISVIAGGRAHGDENTIALLKQCEQSDALYGQEATLANKALLKTAEIRQVVPDYSSDNNNGNKEQTKI
ncbi:hypothetical protein IJ182_08945 [bacterium]|nr:hypothetical protein [bacterium]